MELNSTNVLSALGSVLDPVEKKDVVTLGNVKELKIEGNKISFDLIVKSAALQHKKRMEDACSFAMERNFGSEVTCEINVISKVPVKEEGIPGVKTIIAIASGKGGVGKSTVTANVALGLAKKGYNVAIVDADVYGPSIPIMFNVTDETPASMDVNGVNKMVPVEAYGIKIMSLGFFTEPNQPVTWRGAMVTKALKQMFFDTHWVDIDFMLVDLPPGTGDIHLSLVQSTSVSSAIMVTTPQDVAIADVVRGIEMFKLPNINVPVLGIIENMAWFTPAELPDNKYFIFGKNGGKDLAEKIGVPLIGQLPLIQSVREAGDAGRPAILQESTSVNKYFVDIVDKVLMLQEKREKELPHTSVVQMTK